MTVGENIRKLRLERGLTQKKLGELCNIAEPNIRKYELNKANPKIETIEKIASALGVPISKIKDNIWSEFDIKNPNIAKEFAKFKDFIEFLKGSGYIYKDKVVKWHWEDENETNSSKKVQIPDEWEITLIKDGKEAKFTNTEFTELQEFTKETIEGKFYKKVMEEQKKSK